MPQTPLVDKMFNLQVDSGKKKLKTSGKLLFGVSEQDVFNEALQRSMQDQ